MMTYDDALALAKGIQFCHPPQAASVIQERFNRLLSEALAKLRDREPAKIASPVAAK